MSFMEILKKRVKDEKPGLRFVPGLQMIEDFVLPEEETHLIGWINRQRWRNDLGRRVQQYGYRYDYKTRRMANDVDDIPEPLKFLVERLVGTGLMSRCPDQIIINEYKSNQGIAPHTDHQRWFGGEIATLSLGNTEAMDFKRGSNMVCTMLYRRSVAVMKDEARYYWTHAITPKSRNAPRISITFRWCAPAALQDMGVLAGHNQPGMDEERATVSPPPIPEEHMAPPAPVKKVPEGGSEGDAADPIVVEEPKGDAADPVVVEDSPPGKRKADDDGKAPEPKNQKVILDVGEGESISSKVQCDSPESPSPENQGPPEEEPAAMEEEPADTEKALVDTEEPVALGTLVGICVGLENPSEELTGSTEMNVWFPNDVHPDDLKEGKAFKKDGPDPDGESQYHSVINGDGYDRIMHLLEEDVDEEWEPTGDYEPSRILTGVPITDERIRLRIVRLGLKETKWEWHPKTEKNVHEISID